MAKKVKTIPLPSGHSAIIDPSDYALISAFNWYVIRRKRGRFYVASTDANRKTIYLHRIIMGAKSGEVVDHIDGNGLDNRKTNLRICGQSLNSLNRHRCRVGRDPKYIGVHRNLSGYIARICIESIRYNLGTFKTIDEAATVRGIALDKYMRHGILPASPHSVSKYVRERV